MSRHSTRSTELHSQPAAAPSAPARPRARVWMPWLLGLCGVLTVLTGFVGAWFAVFQLFGARPGSEDYQVAAGVYAFTALVLVLGAAAAQAHETPEWQLAASLGAAALFVVLALGRVSDAAAADPGFGNASWTDGALGVLACPWSWPLVVLGCLAPFRSRRVSG